MLEDFKYLFQSDSVYLDHNATTPLAHQVAERVPAWLKEWGNPSSIHWAGRGPKALLREARRSLAKALNCEALEIVFTSGGSEANNYALKGLLQALLSNSVGKKLSDLHVVSSPLEHPSILNALKFLQTQGLRVSYLSVCREGKLDLNSFDELLRQGVSLVTVMYANNETGHVFPIEKMVQKAHQAGALFHCDMVQALGKTPVDLKALGVDTASFSGHKFYALKGSGFLYVRGGLQLESLIHGGAQERRRRAGTENVLAIASLGEMAKFLPQVSQRSQQVEELRDHMEDRILAEISDALIYGRQSPRLANTSSVVIPGVDGETLLMNLDMEGFAVSTGAACSSGNPEPSPVLLAMGLSREEAQASLRISLGWGTGREQIDRFIETLKAVVQRLRSFQQGGSSHVI